MRFDYVNVVYLLAAVLFIFGLKGLAHPRTAVRGNLLGAVGMLLAVVVTLLDRQIIRYELIIAGLVVGAFIGALFAGEFKIRLPRQKIRYVQAVGGGVTMGYGAGITMGCTIGAFFSAIPSLAINGWVFAVFLAVGAWVGTKIIQRIP